MEKTYQSQYQQDDILNQLYFKDKQNGVFVDIGAHDGKTLSNTYFFEKVLNWRGMCIEPLPKVFQQLKLNRDCILIEGGELEVLKQIDYDTVNIDVLLVENNYEDETLRSFLQSKGYVYTYRIAIDDVFVKQDTYIDLNNIE